MRNLSKEKREKFLSCLQKLREEHQDDDMLRTINEIQQALTEKKYGLVWEQYSEDVDEKLKDNIPIFTEVKDKEIINSPKCGYNFLLEGDNLHSLKLLEKTHKDKIDLIYIDPPYNTGSNDFVYDDNYIDTNDDYRHSKWLSFMSKRLEIAKTLLKDDGVIFISIDDNENAQLKLLCNEIFGENNFVTAIHVELSATQGMKVKAAKNGNIVKNGEYILVYSKNGKKNIGKNILYDLRPEYDTHYNKIIINGKLEQLKNAASNIIEDEFKKDNLKDLFIKSKAFRKFVEDNLEIIVADDKISGYDLKDYPEGKIFEVENNNRTYLIFNNGKKIRQLLKLSDSYGQCNDFNNSRGLRKIRGDWWKEFYLDMGNVSKEGSQVFENGKKPVRLIKQIIYLATDKNATVLDFFAGSGTTGHAVIQLNKEDGGNRKYILCTNNQNKICEEVTYNRLCNIQEELPHNLKYLKTSFIPKIVSEDGNVQHKLLESCKPLIELVNLDKIDNKNILVVFDEAEIEKSLIEANQNAKLYVPSGVFLSSKEENIAAEKNVIIQQIPDCFYTNELREIGEV